MELRSGDARCEIVPERGAIVTRWSIGTEEVLYLDESTLADKSKNVRGGIPLLFPSPGKLGSGRYAMKQHGFARDEPFETKAREASRATLELRSNERTRAVYPFEFALRIEYALAPSALSLRALIENTGGESLPFAFGVHPYFRVRDKASARVPTRATRAFDNVKKEHVPLGALDLTAGEVDLHLVDHGASEADLVADMTATKIRGSRELTRWVIWTLPGKEFVCLEPWTAPADALHTGESLIELAPGEARALEISFERP